MADTFGNLNIDLNEPMTKAQINERIKELQQLKREKDEEERRNKGPARRGRGILSTAKKILWNDPEMDVTELHKKVVEQCGPCSLTVLQTVKSDFRNTIEVLRSLGKLKEEPGMGPKQKGNGSDTKSTPKT